MSSVRMTIALVAALIAACTGRAPGLGQGSGFPTLTPQRGVDTDAAAREGRAEKGAGEGDRGEKAGDRQKGEGISGKKGGDAAGKEAKAPPKPTTAVIPFLVVPRFFPPEPSTIEQGLLFAFDEATTEVFALPGAGLGALGPTYFGDRYILFYRMEGGIFAFDTVTQTVLPFNDVNGWLSSFRPSISKDGRTMVFLADPPGVPPVRGIFGREPTEFTRVYLYRDGAVGELAVINALARQEGGIDRAKISGNGEVVVFSTNLGGVYVYTIGAEIPYLAQAAPARDPAISSDGSVLAWSIGRGAEPRRLFVTLVSKRSEPIDEPTHETAAQVMVPPWWQPPSTERQKASSSPPPLALPRPLVIYRPSHPEIPLPEIPLVAGPRIVSFTVSNDRLQFVSFDENQGFFRWWRYVFFNSSVELLSVLNLANLSDSPRISDLAGSD